MWQPAYDGAGGLRDRAWVAELTGLLDLTGWPPGMRVIARKERPHPGAQLRITDVDGLRVTAFATNTGRGQLADLSAAAPPPGPLRGPDPHRQGHRPGQPAPARHEPEPGIWCAVVALACELTAWLQMLALTAHPARRWEPKRLRLRLFSLAGRLARTARRTVLHLPRRGRWTGLLTHMILTLRQLPAPAT